jgi:hypothetical protein
MFLHQSLQHLLAPVAIPNGMPTRKSRVTTLGRNHPIVKTSDPFLMNVYLVLVLAVDPLLQGLLCFNQLPSHLLMVLVGSRSEVNQLLGLLWIFIMLPLPERIACKEFWEHTKTLRPNLRQWLWRHSDCYDLRKVQMRLKGRVIAIQLSTRKHTRDKILVTALLWFLLQWRSAWTRQHKQIKCYSESKSQLYITHGERSTMRIPKMPVS